jgi:ABC-type transport system involved in multi-copper enzyme maturation permease subunit
MNSLFIRLARRDMRKIFNLRTILIWGALTALGVFFFFTTGGRTILIEKNEVEFMSLFLPQIIFGAWAVLSVYFDLVSSDRQHNVLDCILTAGISKRLVFCSKMLSIGLASFILSLVYLLPVSAVIVVLSGNLGHCAAILTYFLPLWGYIMVFASLGVAISIVARSTKTALIVSLASGLVLMHRLFIAVIDGLGALFGWAQATKDAIAAIAPGVMMEKLAHSTDSAAFIQTAALFIASVTLLLTIAFIVFRKQDELNYGE